MIQDNIASENSQIKKNADKLLAESLILFEQEQYNEFLESVTNVHKLYLSINSIENISICLSFIGLTKYLLDPLSYYKSLLILEDAKFLAQSSMSDKAGGVNRFAFSQLSVKEGNYSEALLYLNRAVLMLNEFQYIQMRAFEELTFVNTELKQFEKAYKAFDMAVKLAKELNIDTCNGRLNKIYETLQSNNEIILNKAADSMHNSTEQTEKISTDPMIALLKIARTINAQMDLDTLLTTIAEQTKIALNADRCTVFLIDKQKNELWSKVALGLGSSEVIRFPLNKGLAGHVAETGETINIKNAYQDCRFNKEIDQQTGYKTNNILCMPIRNIKFEIIGVFQVLNKLNGDFTSQDENLLITIGSSAGIALENTRLFDSQQRMIEEQKQLFSSFVDTLAASIDARDKITSGHSLRVRLYSKLISKKLELSQKDIENIEQAAILHDIGKIGIRDSVLQKKGSLTPDEYDHIKEHVSITHDILSKIYASDEFKDVIAIASTHHEKFDGKGYYRQITGQDIPFGGRILAVADVFDAITSKRHYREKMPIENAIDILIQGENKHFDKKVTDAFLSIPCSEIIQTFITEYMYQIEPADNEILNKYSLFDLYNFIKNNTINETEVNFINTFKKYYEIHSKEN